MDLTFFLYSCTEQTLREQYYEEILKEYHFTFTSVLKELKCDPNLIPYDEFLLEIKNVGLFAIGMSMEAVVMSLIDDDEVANIDEIAVSIKKGHFLVCCLKLLNNLNIKSK